MLHRLVASEYVEFLWHVPPNFEKCNFGLTCSAQDGIDGIKVLWDFRRFRGQRT